MFDQGQMPMTSYANNNALAGLAGNFGGGGWQGFGKLRGMMGGAPGMQPPMPPGTPPAPVDPALQQPSALGAFGQPAPLTIGPQGIPQAIGDWRQQMQDWRGLRPDRPEGPRSGWAPDVRQDWRGQIQDWRGQRPQFPGWR